MKKVKNWLGLKLGLIHKWRVLCPCNKCAHSTRIHRVLCPMCELPADAYLTDIVGLDPEFVCELLAEPGARQLLESEEADQ